MSELKINHPELVKALAKPPVAVLQDLTEESVDLWHGATGVAGEAGELLEAFFVNATGETLVDITNLIEELGDIEFYLQMLRANAGLIRRDVDHLVTAMFIGPEEIRSYAVHSAILSLQILDTVKKCAIYAKPLDIDLLSDQMWKLDTYLGAIMLGCGIQRATVLRANIDKLSKRYESLSYSNAAAQERADKVERKPFPGEPRTDDMDHLVEAERNA